MINISKENVSLILNNFQQLNAKFKDLNNRTSIIENKINKTISNIILHKIQLFNNQTFNNTEIKKHFAVRNFENVTEPPKQEISQKIQHLMKKVFFIFI